MFRVRGIVLLQFLLNPLEPLLELFGGPRVQRRKAADHSRLALRKDKFRHRDDEHGRSDHGKPQPLPQYFWKAHIFSVERNCLSFRARSAKNPEAFRRWKAFWGFFTR